MQYQIVSKQSGYLRLRFGKYVFTKKQGYGISALLRSISGVNQVRTNPVNGSVQIEYEGDLESRLLCTLKELCQKDLTDGVLPKEQQMEELNRDFKDKLIRMVAGKVATSLFMPNLMHTGLVWYRGGRYLRMGLGALRHRRLSVDVLDATAISVSLATGQHDTASSIMFLLGLSDLMLEYSNARAKHALADSLAIQISRVWKIEDGEEVPIMLDELKIEDIIRVRAGSMIPVDGSIVSGDALINEATMTGEPLPVHKSAGNTVFAGTVLETGELDICVRTLSDDSRIAKIIQLIDTGEESKAQIQGKAERLADGIVPVSFGLFMTTLLFTGSIARATSVLMVDFSCAIKLTTPISIISALREGAQRGIVVKGGKYLEILADVDTVVFDKTGTLTNAVPKVSRVISISDSYDTQQVLSIAACLEEHFPHSMAASIVSEAEARGIHHPEEHEKVEYIVAHGIASGYKGHRAIIGSRHFIFEDEKVPYPADNAEEMEAQIGSDSAVFLAIDQVLIGVICISDPPREDAKATIEILRAQGIKEILMITGDGEGTAKYISSELGLDGYFAAVLPDGKAALIDKLKAEGKTVLMVGDGINDAPALSCANVSMTLNGSSDIAREVSDIAIMSHKLDTIIEARKLASALMRKISNNYHFIVCFNSGLIGCGILGLLPAATTAWLHNTSTVALAGLSARPILPKNEKEATEYETA